MPDESLTSEGVQRSFFPKKSKSNISFLFTLLQEKWDEDMDDDDEDDSIESEDDDDNAKDDDDDDENEDDDDDNED